MELTGTHPDTIEVLAKGDLFIPQGMVKYEEGMFEVVAISYHETDFDMVWIDYIRIDGTEDGASFARDEDIFVVAEMNL